MKLKKTLLFAAIVFTCIGVSVAQNKAAQTAKETKQHDFIGKKNPDFKAMGFSICSIIIANENYYAPTGYDINVLVKEKDGGGCNKQGKRFVFLIKKTNSPDATHIADQIIEILPANTYFSFEEVVYSKTGRRNKYLVKYSTSNNRIKLINAWSINKETSKFEAVTVTPDMQIRFDTLGC